MASYNGEASSTATVTSANNLLAQQNNNNNGTVPIINNNNTILTGGKVDTIMTESVIEAGNNLTEDAGYSGGGNAGGIPVTVNVTTAAAVPGVVGNEKAGEYVRELLYEKQTLDPATCPNALRLLDQEVSREVARVQTTGKPSHRESKYVDIYREKPIRVSVKVLVPTREHPKFNFVGKLLGPKGNSMKRLQEDTMTKMAVLGRGSMKDKQKEEELRASLDPKYSHLSDELHVEIAAFAPPAEAHARIAYALAELRKYLIPDSNDEIRQEQMREMEMIQTDVVLAPAEVNSAQHQLLISAPEITGAETGASPLLARKAAVVTRGGLRTRAGLAVAAAAGGGGGAAAGTVGTRGRAAVARKALGPAAQPVVLTPRPSASKNKVMSILDRARAAMDETYPHAEPPYYQYNTGYAGYDDFEDAAEFYDSSPDPYPAEDATRWKGLKLSGSARYRSTPYARPTSAK